MDKNNFDQLGFPVNDNSDDFGTTGTQQHT